jgi:hypothetical protein
MTVTLKRGDTKVNLKATLSNESGPVDLTGCQVRFFMSKRNSNKVNKEALIQTETMGLVWVVFEQEDTDTSGTFQAEFEVTFPDERKETFPNNGYILINIQSDLG